MQAYGIAAIGNLRPERTSVSERPPEIVLNSDHHVNELHKRAAVAERATLLVFLQDSRATNAIQERAAPPPTCVPDTPLGAV